MGQDTVGLFDPLLESIDHLLSLMVYTYIAGVSSLSLSRDQLYPILCFKVVSSYLPFIHGLDIHFSF